MTYTVLLTDTAKQDLMDIAFRIAEQSKDTGIAGRFLSELQDACQKLDTFPNSGSYPDDSVLKSMGYRFAVHKNYLIFYLTDEEKKIVYIMAVFNAKRDYMRIMKKFI